jgi:hypothetical protein
MISGSLTRRLEHLEYRFEPVGEPTTINLQFVDSDLRVIDQMLQRCRHARTTLSGERDGSDVD